MAAGPGVGAGGAIGEGIVASEEAYWRGGGGAWPKPPDAGATTLDRSCAAWGWPGAGVLGIDKSASRKGRGRGWELPMGAGPPRAFSPGTPC